MLSYFMHLYGACVTESGSNMWIYVFLGNALRGIGETPVTPLGISYIDDFARAENSPFYIGKIFLLVLKGSKVINNVKKLTIDSLKEADVVTVTSPIGLQTPSVLFFAFCP